MPKAEENPAAVKVPRKSREKALRLSRALKELYPDADCTLDYAAPYQLLFNTRLAAQCTDARVNLVAPALYEAYPTLEALADAKREDVERLVHACGFFRQKARDIIESAGILLREYDGRVPDTMEDLLRLPGVGRKTASLILGELYARPAAVVDTHCIRLTNRFGLCDTRDPLKVERRLFALLPPEELLGFCHRLVHHGRALCDARKPRCGDCPLRGDCDYGA